MKNKIRYTCSGYKYAPESFKCYMVVINPDGINHSYYLIDKFTDIENSNIGNICVSKGKLAAEAEIKRLLRSKLEYYNYITYGYKNLESSLFTYILNEKVRDTSNIKEKLALYKLIKNYYKSKNYIIKEGTINFCELDANFNAINNTKKDIKHILNTTPIKIRLVEKQIS